MIIILKHNNTTIVGIYETFKESVFANFQFEILPNREIKVTSNHFENYTKTEIVSTMTYSKKFSELEVINDYVFNYFKKDVKRYDINFYKIQQL